jgi:CheY-like chemotaxis protein
MNQARKVEQTRPAIMKALEYAGSGCTAYPPYVLIVADSLVWAFELKRSLEIHGCQVEWTDTSSSGLATACQRYYDAIVLNLERPGANCFEMCKKLKANPGLSDMPVVILTAHAGIREVPGDVKIGKLYCLSYALTSTGTRAEQVDRFVAAKLLPIIEQIHYLIYRYL